MASDCRKWKHVALAIGVACIHVYPSPVWDNDPQFLKGLTNGKARYKGAGTQRIGVVQGQQARSERVPSSKCIAN
jgi:hypothetical protein